MRNINITDDAETYDELKRIAVTFKDTTPNHVIRRLLGLDKKSLVKSKEASFVRTLPSNLGVKSLNRTDGTERTLLKQSLIELKENTRKVHSAFLTFLLDKRVNGNFSSSHIVPFMKKYNLIDSFGNYINPWMPKPYGSKGDKDSGERSCTRTIEHFRQCRKFGCWSGKDNKKDCADISCMYHPGNPKAGPGKANKCDLRKGVIWKRAGKGTPFSYGINYLDVVKDELLGNQLIPLNYLLGVFYNGEVYNNNLLRRFKDEFHFTRDEMDELFIF